MARSRRALMLVTTLAVVVVARAAGQSVPPAPASLPDPAAVLLPPVVSASRPDRIAPVRSDDALPVADPVRDDPPEFRDPPPRPRPKPEPAARLRWDDGQSSRVRTVDYEESQRSSTAYTDPDAARRNADPYEYLTGRAGDFRAAYKDDEYAPRPRGIEDDRGLGERLGDRIHDLLGGKGGGGHPLFQGDHAFDHFVSPVSNPFYAEDPRSVTELRPIVIFQKIPDGQPTFRGGSTMFFGGQARLALGERWSIVMNKVGVSSFRPGDDARPDLGRNTGLSEFWIGPKVVLIRDPASQTLLSAGATFQIPLGSGKVYQDTGRLSIVPYVSAAQKLMSTAWGTFNGMATAGYSFGTNRDRSDFVFASAHLDFDINDKHRFYPLAELNWFGYTTNGRARDLGVEGRDLANIGAAAKGSNLVTWALGGRYKTAGRWEFGAAFEAPLLGPRDLFNYRFTLDAIWRY